MYQYQFIENGRKWLRIPKNQAERVYRFGHAVAVCPAKLRPFGPWSPAVIVIREEYGEDFGKACDYIRYHQHLNSETGRYLSYYIPVCDVDRFTGERVPEKTPGSLTVYDVDAYTLLRASRIYREEARTGATGAGFQAVRMLSRKGEWWAVRESTPDGWKIITQRATREEAERVLQEYTPGIHWGNEG